jgi:hypothetical protein
LGGLLTSRRARRKVRSLSEAIDRLDAESRVDTKGLSLDKRPHDRLFGYMPRRRRFHTPWFGVIDVKHYAVADRSREAGREKNCSDRVGVCLHYSGDPLGG